MTSLVDVPGVQNTTRAFRDKVIAIAEEIRTDPNFLMAIMSFETGGTLLTFNADKIREHFQGEAPVQRETPAVRESFVGVKP